MEITTAIDELAFWLEKTKGEEYIQNVIKRIREEGFYEVVLDEYAKMLEERKKE